VPQADLHDHTLRFIAIRENEILISCNWSMSLPTGNDVLTLLLKMCSNFDSCNFTPMLSVVHKLATDNFLTDNHLFKMHHHRQSTLYFASLHAVCKFRKQSEFFSNFLTFLQAENISFDLKAISVLSSSFDSDLVKSRIEEICLQLQLFSWLQPEADLFSEEPENVPEESEKEEEDSLVADEVLAIDIDLM